MGVTGPSFCWAGPAPAAPADSCWRLQECRAGPSRCSCWLGPRHKVPAGTLLTCLPHRSLFPGLEQRLLHRVCDHADQCHAGEGEGASAVWSQQSEEPGPGAARGQDCQDEASGWLTSRRVAPGGLGGVLWGCGWRVLRGQQSATLGSLAGSYGRGVGAWLAVLMVASCPSPSTA